MKFATLINARSLPESTDPDFDFDYVDISRVTQGVIDSEPQAVTFRSAPSRARRLADPGDTVVSTVRTYLRAVAEVSPTDMPQVFSTGFAVIKGRPGILDPRFLTYYLQSSPFVERVVADSVGVSYPAINASDLAAYDFWAPNMIEQTAIADFLDRETAQIDAMIEAQERVVHLSQEHRAAVVAQTLEALETGGAPTVPLRYCLMVQSGVTLGYKPSEDDEEYPYLRVANVQTGWLDLDVIKTVRVAPDVARRAMLRTGDVLITEGGDRTALGRGALWRGEIPGALHQNHIFALRCRDCLDPSFLVYVLDTPAARIHFESTRRQTTNLSSTNTAKVKAFKTPLPPVTRQKEVVAELDGALESVNEVIAAAQRVTILLRERREALITAAVSGRIDPTTGIERIEEAS